MCVIVVLCAGGSGVGSGQPAQRRRRRKWRARGRVRRRAVGFTVVFISNDLLKILIIGLLHMIPCHIFLFISM